MIVIVLCVNNLHAFFVSTLCISFCVLVRSLSRKCKLSMCWSLKMIVDLTIKIKKTGKKERTPMFYMGRISRLYFHAVKRFDSVSPFCFQFVMHTCTVTFTLFDICVWSILYMYCCFLFDFWSNWQLRFPVKRNTGKMLLSFCQAFFKQWLPFQELFSQKRNSALCSFSQLCFVCSILF